MDDKDKSLFDSLADTVKHTFEIATEAGSNALEPEPLKRNEELVVVPAPSHPFFSDTAAPLIAIVKKKPRKKSDVDTSGRITPDYDFPVPETPMPSPSKASKKASKNSATKADSKTVKT